VCSSARSAGTWKSGVPRGVDSDGEELCEGGCVDAVDGAIFGDDAMPLSMREVSHEVILGSGAPAISPQEKIH